LLGVDISDHPAMRPVTIGQFLNDCAYFSHHALPLVPTIGSTTRVIFEGAQGLELDQEYGAFPHVTRSHTGLRNIMALAPELGVVALDVQYMTRAYKTRHGAGPLPGELGCRPSPYVQDETNIPNEFQETLRFAPLDPLCLRDAIQHDL